MNRRNFCRLLAAGAMAAALPAAGAAARAKEDPWPAWLCEQAPPRPPAYKVSDAHFHFYDFVHHTDGVGPLIEAMNENGVEHIMFSGMPLVKKWNRSDHRPPAYYLDNNGRTYWYSATDMLVANTVLNKIPPGDRPRFHPFICGFNATDMYAHEHVERMLDEYGDLWHGIGEAFGHRDDLTNMTYGETARADHPALMKVYALAAEKDLPVVLHNNVSSRGRAAELLYWPEVERAASENPGTRMVWAHAGLSRYFEAIDQSAYTARLGGLLEKCPNLSIDLSWVVFEDYVAPDPSAGPLASWLDLVSSFAGRFLIGSDSIGHFAEETMVCAEGGADPTRMKYANAIRKYYVLLDRLSPEAARLVGRDNFLNLLPAGARKRAEAA